MSSKCLKCSLFKESYILDQSDEATELQFFGHDCNCFRDTDTEAGDTSRISSPSSSDDGDREFDEGRSVHSTLGSQAQDKEDGLAGA